MEQFTKIINFIMHIIDLIKKFFGGKSDDDAAQPDNDIPEQV